MEGTATLDIVTPALTTPLVHHLFTSWKRATVSRGQNSENYELVIFPRYIEILIPFHGVLNRSQSMGIHDIRHSGVKPGGHISYSGRGVFVIGGDPCHIPCGHFFSLSATLLLRHPPNRRLCARSVGGGPVGCQRRAAGRGPADGPSVHSRTLQSSGKYCSSTAKIRNVHTSVDAFVDGRFIIAFTRAL